MAPSLHWFLLLCPGLPISSLQSDNEICILGKGGSQWGSSNPAPDSELGVRALCLEGGGREKYLGHHVWSSNISRIQDYFFFSLNPSTSGGRSGLDSIIRSGGTKFSRAGEFSHFSVLTKVYSSPSVCMGTKNKPNPKISSTAARHCWLKPKQVIKP